MLSFIREFFNQYPAVGFLVIFAFFLFWTLFFIGRVTEKHKIAFFKRKEQAENMLVENVMRAKINEIINKKTKLSTRKNIELVCLQAGYNIDFDRFVTISLISAVVFSMFGKIFLNNWFLAVVLLVVGAVVPYQVFLVKRNKRLEKIEEQIGPCMNLLIERYGMSGDMKASIEATIPDFKGVEPMGKELQRLSAALKVGTNTAEAMHQFAERLGNKFMVRFADYYEMSESAGTAGMRELLSHSYQQYQMNQENKVKLKKEIFSIKSDGFIVLFSIPAVAMFQAVMDPDYLDFMTNTVVGQIGTTFVVTIFLFSFWFLTKKVGAPIDEEKKKKK